MGALMYQITRMERMLESWCSAGEETTKGSKGARMRRWEVAEVRGNRESGE